jgi:hypothetical protein
MADTKNENLFLVMVEIISLFFMTVEIISRHYKKILCVTINRFSSSVERKTFSKRHDKTFVPYHSMCAQKH